MFEDRTCKCGCHHSWMNFMKSVWIVLVIIGVYIEHMQNNLQSFVALHCGDPLMVNALKYYSAGNADLYSYFGRRVILGEMTC